MIDPQSPLPLLELTTGMPIPFGGDRVTVVTPELAAAFLPGDRLVVVQTNGHLLHIAQRDATLVATAVAEAQRAFHALASVSDDQITTFYDAFARRLASDESFAPIASANDADVVAAQTSGRSTTRLVLSPTMRADMIAGLQSWRDTASTRDAILERHVHDGWTVEQRRAPLGVVGFVFEGRPNVFADATGVLRSGNTVVFRIGSDALGTAKAIVSSVLTPALEEAGLPAGSVRLLDSAARGAGWALFSHTGLALAVARGSGGAVDQLGAVARQAGIPVSLHGTGGGWLVAAQDAPADDFAAAVKHSLDRKVCNTLNVCVIVGSARAGLVPRFLAALEAAAALRQTAAKLHVVHGSEQYVDPAWFNRQLTIRRAEGERLEPQAEMLAVEQLGTEWEWEDSPEVTLLTLETVEEAIATFNTYSPRLVASFVSADQEAQERFYAAIDAPFVGNGFTRWVDGQFALDRPELGLSNWQQGRLFARSAILSGDSVFTVRTRVTQSNHDLHR